MPGRQFDLYAQTGPSHHAVPPGNALHGLTRRISQDSPVSMYSSHSSVQGVHNNTRFAAESDSSKDTANRASRPSCCPQLGLGMLGVHRPILSLRSCSRRRICFNGSEQTSAGKSGSGHATPNHHTAMPAFRRASVSSMLYERFAIWLHSQGPSQYSRTACDRPASSSTMTRSTTSGSSTRALMPETNQAFILARSQPS